MPIAPTTELAPDADLYRDLVQRFQADPEIRKWLRWANEHGMPFASPSAFTRWLQNPSIAGARVYGVSQKIRVPDERHPGRTKLIRRHNKPGQYGEVHWDAHPALITREQHAWLLAHFEANRLNREDRQARDPKLKDGQVRAATGLGVCAACGKRLSVHHNPAKERSGTIAAPSSTASSGIETGSRNQRLLRPASKGFDPWRGTWQRPLCLTCWKGRNQLRSSSSAGRSLMRSN